MAETLSVTTRSLTALARSDLLMFASARPLLCRKSGGANLNFCSNLFCLYYPAVSREYAQKLRHYFPKIDDAGIGVVGVSLGTVDAAKDFCAETGFPLDNMFMVRAAASPSRRIDLPCVRVVFIGKSSCV